MPEVPQIEEARRKIQKARKSGTTSPLLSDLGLTKPPDSFANLSNLKELYLSFNQLSSLPDSFANLSNLKELYLYNNQLSSLPDSFANLSNLSLLDLGNNQLTTLPDSFGNLSNLKELYLDNNQLTTLPDSLANLSNLSFLYLENNPKLGIPPEILNKKPADILRYYFLHCAPNAKKRPLNEAKVLLVGEGGSGKTSLIKRIRKRWFDLHEGKTRGIDIHKHHITCGSEKIKIQLNIWDFGGQEIMHATHQFFLTKRSLYLLVVNARTDEHANRLEYWLKLIESFSDNSPVIVVINHIDQHNLELNRRSLCEKYPQIRDFLKTSCKTSEGIQELSDKIQELIPTLEHVGDHLPKTWFEVKATLERSKKDWIGYQEYTALCEKRGISDADDQRLLVGFLHDLGTVLNYRDDPRLEDTNILNPEWVTDAVYKILNDERLVEQRGRLTLGRLHEILAEKKLIKREYPREKREYILAMMRKFELCFEIEGSNPPEYLVPDLLGKERPEFDWPKEGTLNFEYYYEVLPGSILSRFIVRQHKCLADPPILWRTGVVLEIHDCHALVYSDLEDKKMFISIQGARKREALAVIRNEFRTIHSGIAKLPYDERVPLPGFPGKTVSYRHLLELERLGIKEFLPEGANKMFSVSELLNGVVDQEVREKERNQSITKYEHCTINDNSRNFTGSNPGQASMGDHSSVGDVSGL